ncbi:recombinase family protein [Streptomyces sp. NPDC005407]|uniref:recombinase family protein n=1 Tax=Streptomyces sp. NPDC005407 TaxID=3155340 RepID=UPI0033B8C54A
MTGARIGYDHIRPKEDPEPRLTMLYTAGCSRIYLDIVPRLRSERPALNEALYMLRPGDILVVPKLIRVASGLRQLLDIFFELTCCRAGLHSIEDGFDSTQPGGEVIPQVLAGIIQAEHRYRSESTRDGLHAAAQRGHHPGRRPALDDKQAALAHRLYATGHTITEVAQLLDASQATVRHCLRTPETPDTGEDSAP